MAHSTMSSPRCCGEPLIVHTAAEGGDGRAADDPKAKLKGVRSASMPADETSTALIGNRMIEENIAEVAPVAHKIARPMDNTDFAPSWRGKMTEHYAIAALREIVGLPQLRKRPRHILKML